MFLILCLGAAFAGQAQYKVRGTVFDSSRRYRIEAVTVLSSGGHITMTDTLGRYEIGVSEKDSIWFSFQGKPTPKYPVLKIADVNQFDIAMKLKSNVMEEVRIRNRGYIADSIQNRKDYAKVFDYRKVSVGSVTSIGPNGAAFDLDELIRMFQFRKNKNMLKFQQRLVEQEKEKFISHRFNKTLVRELTSLDGPKLDEFMAQYRPTYEFTLMASEYDFRLFIKKAYEFYSSPRTF